MTSTSNILPSLPQSWSELTWEQLCKAWTAKQRYGGNQDVAVVAAMLSLYDLTMDGKPTVSETTGESIYRLTDKDGQAWSTTPRELAHYAHRLLPWFNYPYADHGEPEEKDEKGNVTKEARDPHRGYVNQDVGNWYDAMALTEETVTIEGITFALPQVACSNLTWHQYRSLQAIASQLFQEGIGDEQALQLQAQFLAYILVPGYPKEAASAKVQVSSGKSSARGNGNDPFAPEFDFKYVAERAEQTFQFWQRQLEHGTPLFHICFQVWQTAVVNYYPTVFPLLFGGSGSSSDPLHTALTGEVGTINAVMKYQGYNSPQEIYDTNLPIILGVLNNMTKEAKEIEKMNSKIKRK